MDKGMCPLGMSGRGSGSTPRYLPFGLASRTCTGHFCSKFVFRKDKSLTRSALYVASNSFSMAVNNNP